MLPLEELRIWCIELSSYPSVLQIVPLLILFLVPAFAFFVLSRAPTTRLAFSLAMGLQSLGFTIPWLWSGDTMTASASSSAAKKLKKLHVRSRVNQLDQNGSKFDEDQSGPDDEWYPGLVNVSGTYCFMNSTLQALASLSYLQPHINAIHAKAEVLDVPSPVIDALQDLFQRLNTPRSSYQSIRPVEIIEVLSAQTEGRTNALFHSREHQDAQELFQLVSECIKNEAATVDKEGFRDRGLGVLSQASSTTRDIGKNVFDGLTANRRSCVVCGYTEAVMHFALDSWQLAVPRIGPSCRLEDCLEDYTRLEILKDCVCRKCSVLATYKRLQNELIPLEKTAAPDANPSSSKKRRLKEVRRMEARIKAAIDDGRIEDDIKDVRMEKVFSPASTKQAMIARPPQVLALHINRSVHFGQYATKNNVNIFFPEVLDLTPYTTSGSLSTVPTSAISTPPPVIPRSTTPTPSTYAHTRVIYRLSAVVCHYGQHSYGHYICYRRKPRSRRMDLSKRWAPPRLVDPLCLEEDGADVRGSRYVWDGEEQQRPGKGWLRISDDSVRECGIESVLQEGIGAFMLYYERAVLDRSGIYGNGSRSPRCSEETLKPELRKIELNGSLGSLVSEVGVGVHVKKQRAEARTEERNISVGLASSLPQSQNIGPRIVRNVATRRRSASATSFDRLLKFSSVESPVLNGALHHSKEISRNAKMNGCADQSLRPILKEDNSVSASQTSPAYPPSKIHSPKLVQHAPSTTTP